MVTELSCLVERNSEVTPYPTAALDGAVAYGDRQVRALLLAGFRSKPRRRCVLAHSFAPHARHHPALVKPRPSILRPLASVPEGRARVHRDLSRAVVIGVRDGDNVQRHGQTIEAARRSPALRNRFLGDRRPPRPRHPGIGQPPPTVCTPRRVEEQNVCTDGEKEQRRSASPGPPVRA